MSAAMNVNLAVLVPTAPSRTVVGRAMHLIEPISFWGGVSPADGLLSDPRSVRFGQSVADRVLIVRELRGSSSASSVLLELVYKRLAPCAIILSAADAILALGVLIANEMGWPAPGIFELSSLQQETIPDGAIVSIDTHGVAFFEGSG